MKTGFIAFFLVLCLSSCAGVTRDDTKKANYHYQMGISYLNDNNIQPAFVELQKALELNPYDKDVHEAIGIIYLTNLEDYPKAIKHFQAALKIDKNFSEAANNLGNAYSSLGKFDEAIESYERAISNPQYKNAAMALYNLGMVYYRLSKFDAAMDSYKDALKRFSNFYMPYYGLALCYNAKGQYGDAATAMARAIEVDPVYKGDKKKAIEDLKDKKIRAKGDQEKDIADYLEILKY
jgi:type IV pilus biogenesis/stability protein PilW